ncbi:hypothetical protein SAMD00019534_104620 [Acytostelium subglobosum LB1]|uniref:hypothetical protein n=1 Tax=Acytostelium subglobosum LB1 TaxID=1410327 RepID=UPI000644D9DE|nr:hypothetical protein SAMD00019534_104620 [Acytostelium subglobosum LB1]GAM27287.1 hypothetical protein SAMD00019534_104620 [Acytostelium subglobosum LB1]|eukprot:XP_012749754.1 hypothetical protein SAMD00019534_104620 [Acytostelium subglobosum LB1]
MTQNIKFFHNEWIDRTSIPVARRIVPGHHTTECSRNDCQYGGEWNGIKKSFFNGSRNERKIHTWNGNRHGPRSYNNDMYDQPYIMEHGYHCRKYLLKTPQLVEYHEPIMYTRPYYLERINHSGLVHPSYLSDGSKVMGMEMANRFVKADQLYTYADDLQFKERQRQDNESVLKHQEIARLNANQKAHEKAVLRSKIKRDQFLTEEKVVAEAEPLFMPVGAPIARTEIIEQVPIATAAPIIERTTIVQRPVVRQSTVDPVMYHDRLYVQEPVEIVQHREYPQNTSSGHERVYMEREPVREEAYFDPSNLVEQQPQSVMMDNGQTSQWVSDSGETYRNTYDGRIIEHGTISPVIIRDRVAYRQGPTMKQYQ